MARWHVLHKRLWGENEAQFSMENLHVTWNKGEHGPHELTYDISYYYETDLTQIIPYNIDFGLFRNDREIMQGMVTAVSFESENEYLSVAAKSYLHYLEKRFWPFDVHNVFAWTVGNPGRDLAIVFDNADVSGVIEMILEHAIVRVPNGIPLTYDVPLIAVPMDLEINIADSETILSKIQGLSQQDPGMFDFWMDGFAFKVAYPRRYPITVLNDASACAWVFSGEESGLLNVKYTNNGPEGNHLLGRGTSPDQDEVWTADDAASQNYYRRLDAVQDFGDSPDFLRVKKQTLGYFGTAIQPQQEITLEVYADAVPDFWYGRIYPGCAIWLDYSNGIYHLNSAYEVVSIDLEVNTETDEMVTLNLNQVYPFYEEPAPPIHVAPGTDVNLPPVYTAYPIVDRVGRGAPPDYHVPE